LHDHVDHAALSTYAVDKVNVPKDKAKSRRDQVAHLRTRLENYIKDHPDYDLVKMRGSGSVAKHTAIKTSSDTDVAAYVRASAVGGVQVEEAQLLSWLLERCKEVYGKTKDAEDFKISQHAVGITMHKTGLKIDVAPVLYEGEPDDRGCLVTQSGERVTTSVTQHLSFLNTRARVAGPELKELIRLFKQFIRRIKDESAATGQELRFKSFLAELIIAHLWDNGWNGEALAVKDYPRAFEQILGYIVTTGLQQPIVFTDFYPASSVQHTYDAMQVWDPVNAENNVVGAYTDYDRQRLVDRCGQALDQVSWAAMTTSKGAAVEAWRTLFGPTFSVA
jgi:tRNA nucleotidyltransferase (CCA-adding enzyme)